jgi:hypothetical protein
MWESLQRVVLEEVLGHPRIVGRFIVDVNNSFSLHWIRAIREERVKQGNQVLFNEPCCIERRPRWQHCNNLEPVGIP